MNAFPARYDALCIPCGENINKGDFIANHPSVGYVHEECFLDAENIPETSTEIRSIPVPTPKVMPRGKTARDRCNRCYQIPASNGVCGC